MEIPFLNSDHLPHNSMLQMAIVLFDSDITNTQAPWQDAPEKTFFWSGKDLFRWEAVLHDRNRNELTSLSFR
jgi:hypothetical protein